MKYFFSIALIFSVHFVSFASNEDSIYIEQQFKKIENLKIDETSDTLFSLYKEIYYYAHRKQNKLGIAKSLNSLAWLHQLRGNYSKSLELLFKALRIYESKKNEAGIIKSYSLIGAVYDRQDDFQKALTYYFRGLKIAEFYNDFDLTLNLYNDIAITYTRQGNLDEAEKYYNKSIAINSAQKNENGLAKNLLNLGNLYAQKGQNYVQQAFSCYLEALEICEQMGFKMGIANCEINLAAQHCENKNFKQAEYFLERALKTVYLTGDKGFLSHTEKIASQICSEMGKDKLALIHYKRHIELKDSLFSLANTEKMLAAEINYAFEKKQQKIKFDLANVKTKIEIKHKQNILLISFLIMVLIFGMILFYFIRRANEGKKKISELIIKDLNRKDLFAQEVNHRINNNIQIMSSLLGLQVNQKEDEKFSELLTQCLNRINSLGGMNELLVLRDDQMQIEMHNYLTRILSFHLDIFSNQTNSVKIRLNISKTYFLAKTAVPIALIVNELVSNAIKYAFDKESEKLLIINLIHLENTDNNWMLSVVDNGRGLPKTEYLRAGSLGLRIVRMMAKEINGELNFKNDNGLQVEIIFSTND